MTGRGSWTYTDPWNSSTHWHGTRWLLDLKLKAIDQTEWLLCGRRWSDEARLGSKHLWGDRFTTSVRRLKLDGRVQLPFQMSHVSRAPRCLTPRLVTRLKEMATTPLEHDSSS